MDRNTMIGLGLIGVILAIFTYINQPNPEEIEAQRKKAEQELAERRQSEQTDLEASNDLPEHFVVKRDSLGVELTDSIGRLILTDTITGLDSIFAAPSALSTNDVAEIQTATIVDNDYKGETIVLENDKLYVELSTKGGGVQSVFLKEHQTYQDFKANEKGKVSPLQLFEHEKSTNQVIFSLDGKEIQTGILPFEVVQNSSDYIELRHNFDGNKSISFIYSILPSEYHMNYAVQMKGFEGSVLPENVFIDWTSDLLQTERLLSEQRRTSTVFFKGIGESYDYLSEFSDDEIKPEMNLEWVAFKQSYFSSMLIPEKGFSKEGSQLIIKNYGEGHELDSTHIKRYSAKLNLNISSTKDGEVSMKWFFGPNDYYLLATYNNSAEDIVNLGWGIFRWVNIYAIQPIFTWLTSFGLNLGLAIFLLTLIVKIALTPIQWKMYTSSAKMRILKPEIDELNKKYPNKEDGMKKQMEMMTLYRESGASPLAGCVPMLIQMPILFAVFRFFPSTFELRQKSFLWADDLSSFDSVLDLGFNIPFYGDHVSLFTLLMSATTLVYTIMNSGNMQQPSQPGMPNMKVIMYIFPIMMIFFFNNFASGLSYYYFISTLISILTMLMIKHFFVDEEKLKAKMAARKATAQSKTKGGGGKKSKFQERLEQMQKTQQERMKGKK
jgi:YidC/Oxa1 family membrane protein insertase